MTLLQKSYCVKYKYKQNPSNFLGSPENPAMLGLRDFPPKGLDAYSSGKGN